jgi:hypothetical protein
LANDAYAVDQSENTVYTALMILIADSENRVRLPEPIKPGDAVSLESIGDAQFLMKKVASSTQVTFKRKDGFLVASSNRPITLAQTRALMDEFP